MISAAKIIKLSTKTWNACISQKAPRIVQKITANYFQAPHISHALLRSLLYYASPKTSRSVINLFYKEGISCSLYNGSADNILRLGIYDEKFTFPLAEYKFHKTHYRFVCYTTLLFTQFLPKIMTLKDFPPYDSLRMLNPDFINTRARPIKDTNNDGLAIIVGQKQYSITTAKSLRTKLKTMFISSCIAITLYDPIKKVALLAHIDGLTNLYDSFNEMSKTLQNGFGVDLCNLRAKLVGGLASGSEEHLVNIYIHLRRFGIPVVQMDVLGGRSRHLLLDSCNGEIFYFSKLGSSDKTNTKQEYLDFLIVRAPLQRI